VIGAGFVAGAAVIFLALPSLHVFMICKFLKCVGDPEKRCLFNSLSTIYGLITFVVLLQSVVPFTALGTVGLGVVALADWDTTAITLGVVTASFGLTDMSIRAGIHIRLIILRMCGSACPAFLA
jgi:hypothetical protein